MFLALRDLRRGARRFALVGLVVALVAVLSTVLAALADGLVRDGTSGLRALPLDHLAFQPHAQAVFSRSTLDDEALAVWQDVDGVEASPVGMSFVNAQAAGEGPNIDVALFGVDRGSFLLPNAEARSAIEGRPGLVLAHSFRDEGVQVGDRYRITGSDVDLPVLGFTFAGSYGHVGLAYTSLDTWREISYGSDDRGRFSAVALRVGRGVDLAALDRRAGTETITKAAAYDGSPGFTAETGTMSLIRGFLLVIAALVIGAFFTVLTVQRTRQIGLLKAMGASTAYVLRDGIGQMTTLVVVSTALGTLTGVGLVALLSGGAVPIELTPSTIVVSSLSLVVAGVVGSLVAFRRISQIEPVIALGVEA